MAVPFKASATGVPMMDVLAQRPANAVQNETWDSGGKFFLAMSAISAGIIFLGFAPSFYLKSVIHAPPPLSPMSITHGVVFTAWTLLFLTQAAFIAYRKPAPHRQLGILGVILFGVVLTLGYATAINAGQLGHAPPGSPPPLAFMALPLIGITGTLVIFGVAVWNRRRSDWHKRLMLVSLFTFTSPAVGRLTIPAGVPEHATAIALTVAELLLVAAMVHDYRTNKRVHPAYWFSAIVMLTVQLSVYWAYGSPAWMTFAKAITRG
jgi:uncharacterized membrane protein YozB (DUF420 family)